MKWDLNADLGEGEPAVRTRALMRSITSANVACGGHAGDAESMRRVAQWAKEFGVSLGAHPGTWDRAQFGRAHVDITGDDLELLLLQQVGALERVARLEGVRLHHVKLHGGLYHAVEGSAPLALSYLKTVQHYWPGLKVYARAEGQVLAAARSSSVKVWAEAFVDRAYQADGRLVSRSDPGAMLTGTASIRERLRDLCLHRQIRSIDGETLACRARTLCVHGDEPQAIAVARLVRQFLDSLPK